MADIVERLRGQHWWLNVDGNEAADEIERLRGQVGHLRNVQIKEMERIAEIERLRAREVALTRQADHWMAEAKREAERVAVLDLLSGTLVDAAMAHPVVSEWDY